MTSINASPTAPAVDGHGAKELVWSPESDLTKLLPIKTVERALSGPGMPWELEMKLIDGRLAPRYKNAPRTVRDMWRAAEKVHLHSDCLDEKELTACLPFRRNLPTGPTSVSTASSGLTQTSVCRSDLWFAGCVCTSTFVKGIESQ